MEMEIEGDVVVNYEEEPSVNVNSIEEKNMEVDNNNNNNNNNNNTSENKTFATKRVVDRKRTCPFMVKMYCRINGHHRLEEFTPPRFPVEDELIVYTWKDATLKELSLLVRQVLSESESNVKGSDMSLKFSFNLLYPDNKRQGAHFLMKPMGWAFEGGESEARNLQLTDSSDRTLDSLRFVPGDFIDVAIFTNPAMIPKPIRPHNNNNNGNNRSFNNNQRRF